MSRQGYLVCIGVILCITGVLVGCWRVPRAVAGASSEVLFLELYTRIIRSVQDGDLERDVGEEARALNRTVQKKGDLLARKIGQVKTELREGEVSMDEELLERLIDLGAQRERMYREYWQDLGRKIPQDLGGQGGALSRGHMSSAPATSMRRQKGPLDPSRRLIRIESLPEEVGMGQFD